MRIRYLETFIAIAEGGTLTAAAEQLHKTQGAVSQDLKALEKELGVQLMDRSGRRVKLTQAGVAYLPLARDVLARLEDSSMVVRRVHHGVAGPLRLAVLPSIAGRIAEVVACYRRSRPDALFVVESDLETPIEAALRAGAAELAVAEPSMDDGIAAEPLDVEDVVAVVHASHAFSDREYLRPEDLVDEPMVGWARHLGGPSQALHFFSAVGRYPTPVVEVSDHELMLDLVRLRVGFALMASRGIDGRDGVVAIPTAPALSRRLALLHRVDRVLAPGVVEFRDFLRKHWPTAR